MFANHPIPSEARQAFAGWSLSTLDIVPARIDGHPRLRRYRGKPRKIMAIQVCIQTLVPISLFSRADLRACIGSRRAIEHQNGWPAGTYFPQKNAVVPVCSRYQWSCYWIIICIKSVKRFVSSYSKWLHHDGSSWRGWRDPDLMLHKDILTFSVVVSRRVWWQNVSILATKLQESARLNRKAESSMPNVGTEQPN